MTKKTQIEGLNLPSEYTSYIGERNYKKTDYVPMKKGFSDLCKNCKHYYKNLHERGVAKTDKVPTCKGHVFDLIKDISEKDFDTIEEYEATLVTADPVSWAARYFGWEARWYQEEMMSCTAQKKIVRAGRRVGKTTCIVVLISWLLYTNEDVTVLVIAPYQAQVTKIFDEITKLISGNEELSASIKRNTKNPHRLELANGSKALGFSSGAQSSARSDKIRGQDANYIVLDEADYLADDDLDAILAILASHPDCGLWASSTPTGKHQKYYQWSVQKDLGFKEFHYVSAESPSWTDEVQEFYKKTYNRATYEHEFLAEFGIQEKGVFRNDLLDSSLRQYDLPRNRREGARVVIGVDWNGADIGVHITVTEFDGNIYLLLLKEIIKAGDFTQHEAIARIMELDQKYDADYIYVDAGYGQVQVEMMHKIGLANPDTGWRKKVKAYNFGAKIEIRDPRTGAFVKKAAKPFMVNVTSLQLEQDRLLLPVSEDTQIITEDTQEGGVAQGLVQQMRNFEILRYSSTGLPTYSQGEEHTLIAYMLSIVGFVLEFSDMAQVKQIVGLAVTGPITNITSEGSEDPKKRASAISRQLEFGESTSSSKGAASILALAENKNRQRGRMTGGRGGSLQEMRGKSKIDRTSRFNTGRRNI
jgi:hypothetical protein